MPVSTTLRKIDGYYVNADGLRTDQHGTPISGSGANTTIGSGHTPEGSVTADPGNFYYCNAPGFLSFWLKETGAGNTGWVQLLLAMLMLFLVSFSACAQIPVKKVSTNAVNELGDAVVFTGYYPTFEDMTNTIAAKFGELITPYVVTNIANFTRVSMARFSSGTNTAVLNTTVTDEGYGMWGLPDVFNQDTNCLDFWVYIDPQADVANTNIWLDVNVLRNGGNDFVVVASWSNVQYPKGYLFESDESVRVTNVVDNLAIGAGNRLFTFSQPLNEWVDDTYSLTPGWRLLRLRRDPGHASDTLTGVTVYFHSVTLKWLDQ